MPLASPLYRASHWHLWGSVSKKTIEYETVYVECFGRYTYFSKCSNSTKRVVIVCSHVLWTILYDGNLGVTKGTKVSTHQVSCGTGKKQSDVCVGSLWFRNSYHSRNQKSLPCHNSGDRILAMMLGGVMSAAIRTTDTTLTEGLPHCRHSLHVLLALSQSVFINCPIGIVTKTETRLKRESQCNIKF